MSQTFDAPAWRKDDLIGPSATTGLVAGAAIGLAAGHLGIWVAFGLGLGLAAGHILTSLRRYRRSH